MEEPRETGSPTNSSESFATIDIHDAGNRPASDHLAIPEPPQDGDRASTLADPESNPSPLMAAAEPQEDVDHESPPASAPGPSPLILVEERFAAKVSCLEASLPTLGLRARIRTSLAFEVYTMRHAMLAIRGALSASTIPVPIPLLNRLDDLVPVSQVESAALMFSVLPTFTVSCLPFAIITGLIISYEIIFKRLIDVPLHHRYAMGSMWPSRGSNGCAAPSPSTPPSCSSAPPTPAPAPWPWQCALLGRSQRWLTSLRSCRVLPLKFLLRRTARRRFGLFFFFFFFF